MPELLTHALVGYAMATALSWRYGWVTPPYVTAAMAGAFIPDLYKVALVVPSWRVQVAFDVPFNWIALHAMGGTVLSVLVGVLLVAPGARRRTAAMLGAGAASHLLFDALLINADGHSYIVLWPLSSTEPPTPGLFLSTDVWPTVVAVGLAGGVWWLARRRRASARSDAG